MNHSSSHKKHGEPNKKAQGVVNMALGSLANIPSMIEDGRYCPDVIQQVDSVIGLLNRAREELLKEHLASCLLDRLKTDKESSIKELLKIYQMR
jgi:DNA-binding FrmR family transcriptional regulator